MTTDGDKASASSSLDEPASEQQPISTDDSQDTSNVANVGGAVDDGSVGDDCPSLEESDIVNNYGNLQRAIPENDDNNNNNIYDPQTSIGEASSPSLPPPSSTKQQLSEENEEETTSASLQRHPQVEEGTIQKDDDRKQAAHQPSQPGVGAPGAYFSDGASPPPSRRGFKGNTGESTSQSLVETSVPVQAKMPAQDNLGDTPEEQPPALTAALPAQEESTHGGGDRNLESSRDMKVSATSSPEEIPIPMVQAELVVPPVEAVHVAIDAEMHPTHTTHHDEEQGARQILPMELEQTLADDSVSGTKCYRLRKKTPTGWLCATIFLGFALLSTVIVLTSSTRRAPNIGSGTSKGGDQGSSLDGFGSDKDDAAPSFSYPCFSSTLAILNAQREVLFGAGNGTELQMPETGETYILCPNTIIEVGTFTNPSINDFSVIEGDYPLWVARPNITIQCGLDGSVQNNCTLTGGVMQFLATPAVPTYDSTKYPILEWPLHNIVIRGITFTGKTLNPAPVSGISLLVAQSGSYRFEDCQWVDMFALAGIAAMYNVPAVNTVFDSDFVVQDHSIDVTFSECLFDNIVYDNPLLQVVAQNLTLERCVFRDVQVSVLAALVGGEDQCDLNNVIFDTAVGYGCAEVLYCGPNSNCYVSDTCMEQVHHNGPGIFYAADTANVTLEEASVVWVPSELQEGNKCDVAVFWSDEEIDCIQAFDESAAMTCPSFQEL